MSFSGFVDFFGTWKSALGAYFLVLGNLAKIKIKIDDADKALDGIGNTKMLAKQLIPKGGVYIKNQISITPNGVYCVIL